VSSIHIELDPVDEHPGNTPVALVDHEDRRYLVRLELPAPPEQPLWAESVDTDGARPVGNRHGNRAGQTIGVRIHGQNAVDVEQKVAAIARKVEKIRRDGGTLKVTLPSGNSCTLDLLAGQQNLEFDRGLLLHHRADVTLTFTAAPYWRGRPVEFDEQAATGPVLIYEADEIPGDVPALGQLWVTHEQSTPMWFAMWGLQSRHVADGVSGGLFFEAETRANLSGASAVTGPAGASGTGDRTIEATLNGRMHAILSTREGGGDHLEHTGTFRVFARVCAPSTNTGEVSLAFEWTRGEFFAATPTVRNPDATLPGELTADTFRLVDLGLVDLPAPRRGAARWEGRLLARSTVPGDSLHVDYLLLMPAGEGYGELRGTLRPDDATEFVARDEFDQSAGALHGKALPIGGTWQGSGDSDDFTVDATEHVAKRTATGDTGDVDGGRFAVANTFAQADTLTHVRFRHSTMAATASSGLLARWVAGSQALLCRAFASSGRFRVEVHRYTTSPGWVSLGGGWCDLEPTADAWYSLRLLVVGRRLWVWLTEDGAAPGSPCVSMDSSLIGSLAAGQTGIHDLNGDIAATRSYDDFWSTGAILDPVVPADGALEIRHDGAIRQDATGGVWTAVAREEGDHLLVPPAAGEGRSCRIAVKLCRDDPARNPDHGLNPPTARLTVTPRYLLLPG
jgi:hypothetical protein